MFVRNRSVVTIEETISENGATQLSIEDISAHAFRSEVEKYGTLFVWGRDKNGKAHN